MTRGGKPRYDSMSAGMQAEFRARQKIADGDPESFAIHSPGPRADRYKIYMDGENAVVTYWYHDGYGSPYKGVERMIHVAESGRLVVTGCERKAAFRYPQDTPLLNEAQNRRGRSSTHSIRPERA